jgi:hypothetical protein
MLTAESRFILVDPFDNSTTGEGRRNLGNVVHLPRNYCTCLLSALCSLLQIDDL